MYNFILSHPGYLLLLLFNIAVVIKIFIIVNNRNNDNDDDGGGEEWEDGPKLDLPPGVVLPSDPPEKRTPVLQD